MTYDPAARSTRELLGDFAALMRELRSRGVIRTNNNPIGDIAEAIVAEYYGGTRGGFSQAGWDVITPDGERLQVKAIRLTASNPRRSNLSPIRDANYDAVIVVVFDEEYRVTEGLRIERETVEALFAHRDYVNGRVIRVSDALRQEPGVQRLEITDALLDA